MQNVNFMIKEVYVVFLLDLVMFINNASLM